MSRRTFTAGLLVAVLGGPVTGQSPNPWRGESAPAPNPWRGERTTLTTAPAAGTVSKPSRQLTVGLGFSSVGGLNGNVEVRDLTPTPTTRPSSPRVFSLPGFTIREYGAGEPARSTPAVIQASYTPPAAYMPPPAPLPIPPAAP